MTSTDIRATVKAALGDVDALRRRLSDLLSDLEGTEAVQIPRQGRWTKPDVEALWEKVHHLPGVCALFEVTAEHPNEAVKFTAVLARSGLDEVQQRNEHARMSRVTSELFGEKRWPIENWQGSTDATSGRAEMLYRMGATVAAWWEDIAR